MRILVYGAGVLGCYLAHVLHRGGNDVTLLARGDWKTIIDRDGLIIRHYLQMKTTVDRIKTIDSLAPKEIYDIVFVVMQYTHLKAVIPILAQNESKVIIFVGNNPNAAETAKDISTDIKKTILFGFQASGGRRENGKLICFRLGGGHMSIGGLNTEDQMAYNTVRQAFSGCSRYNLSFVCDMDAWLKSHAVTILPIVYVVYACNGRLKKAKVRLLRQAVQAISEGYAALNSLGITVLPENSMDLLQKKRNRFLLLLWVACKTPIGRLAASDHAMAAITEMRSLHDAFQTLRKRAGIPTPAWDALTRHMPVD